MEKVRLRAIEPEDLDLLYTIENDVSLWNVGTTNEVNPESWTQLKGSNEKRI